MKVRIHIPVDIEVNPRDLIPAAKRVRKKFELDNDAGVFMEDLLWDLSAKGKVDLQATESFRIDDEWEGTLDNEALNELKSQSVKSA